MPFELTSCHLSWGGTVWVDVVPRTTLTSFHLCWRSASVDMHLRWILCHLYLLYTGHMYFFKRATYVGVPLFVHVEPHIPIVLTSCRMYKLWCHTVPFVFTSHGTILVLTPNRIYLLCCRRTGWLKMNDPNLVRVGSSRRFGGLYPEKLHMFSMSPGQPVSGRCVFFRQIVWSFFGGIFGP